MKVLAFVPNVLGFAPGQRSSIEAWEKILFHEGIEIDYAIFETDSLHEVLYKEGAYLKKATEMGRAYFRRARVVSGEIDNYDAALIYREAALVGPALYERVMKRKRIPLIYQLDDPLHVPYRSQFNSYLSYLKMFGKVKTNCRLADAVIVNSGPLREYALQFNDNVWQVPCVVDTDVYSYERKRFDKRICVGWTGSPSTAPNLSVIADPLRVVQERTGCRIHLIGSDQFHLPGVDFTSQPWRSETEVQDLRQIDIGLVPLPDNEWNRWKFFMKVAQYMAIGIPPVATPMGSIPEDIEDGVDGFIAENEEQWIDRLCRLIEDPALLESFSVNAAKKAGGRFSVQANAPTIVSAFRSVMV